jgi:enamine deaminase RidA (YjgF/YER057c/UK114 family)
MLGCEDLSEDWFESRRFLKTAIRAPLVLSEVFLDEIGARDDVPSMPRGTRIDIGHISVLLISGMANVSERTPRSSAYDFRRQTVQTLSLTSALLAAEGATWKDVVSTTWYLRDMAANYSALNDERTAFYESQGLDPIPVSTERQVIFSRPGSLIELEITAIVKGSTAPN